MKLQYLLTALILMLSGSTFAEDVVPAVPEPSVLALITAGAAVGVLLYRNRRK